jgi:hypothetical protein
MDRYRIEILDSAILVRLGSKLVSRSAFGADYTIGISDVNKNMVHRIIRREGLISNELRS